MTPNVADLCAAVLRISWFDPPKETDAAQSLIDQKADVLLQNTDSAAVLQTAEKNGKYAFGWDSDMSAFAPKAHLASASLNWGVYYVKAIGDVLDKTWKTEVTKWGIKEGANDFVKVAAFVPEAAQKKVAETKAYLVENPGAVFKGPLVDNTGKEVLAKDVVADDKFGAPRGPPGPQPLRTLPRRKAWRPRGGADAR
jgi:basic membrane protein A and related proteins